MRKRIAPSTEKQKWSQKRNWALFMVRGMLSQVRNLDHTMHAIGLIDDYSFDRITQILTNVMQSVNESKYVEKGGKPYVSKEINR